MKNQPNKKTTLKLTIDRKAITNLTQAQNSQPPSSKCSQKTISTVGRQQTTSSSKQEVFKFRDSYSPQNPSFVTTTDGNDIQSSLRQSQEEKSKLIEYLLQENIQLKKQNSDKDNIIQGLIQSSSKKQLIIQRANTSNTERSFDPHSEKVLLKKLPLLSQKKSKEEDNQMLGFTFQQCQEVKSQQGIRTLNKRLPKEFQIVPSKKRYFI